MMCTSRNSAVRTLTNRFVVHQWIIKISKSRRRARTLNTGGTQSKHPLQVLVSAEGFEPSTNGLKGHCSAIELRALAQARQIHAYMRGVFYQKMLASPIF